MEYVQNFDGDTFSERTPIWKIQNMDNSNTDLKETGREDGRWMKLAQDRIPWRAVVLAVLDLWVLLTKS
jgi:hypothetical protein